MVFNYFDHRRLITFGVVHGLIQRVHHQYPLAYEVATDNTGDADSRAGRGLARSHGGDAEDPDGFSNTNLSRQNGVPVKMSATTEEAAAAAAAVARMAADERSMATSYSASLLLQGLVAPALPQLQGLAPPPLISREKTRPLLPAVTA